jgi:hypothetical protein
LAAEGVSEEKIKEVLANEKVQTLLLGYQDTEQDSKTTHQNNEDETIGLDTIIVTPKKDLQEYIVDGAKGIKAIVDIVGEDKAAAGILVAQFVFQGTVKTVASLAGDEVKDFMFGGLKEATGNFIAKEYFDVNDAYWTSQQQESINSLSYLTADFGIDALVSGGVFGIIKKAGKLSEIQTSTDSILKVKSGEATKASANNAKIQILETNKVAGAAFEQKIMEELKEVQSGVVKQITVKTESGVKTRIDLVGRDAEGNIICTECKSSSTAPLTNNQKAAFPEIGQSGATVVGKGKEGFEGGTKIPPTDVNIIRPK